MSLFYVFINLVYSICTYFITSSTIPKFSDVFLKAKIFGFDANKKSSREVPEALGVVTGCIYLIFMFLFIPVPFSSIIMKNEVFPHNEQEISLILGICLYKFWTGGGIASEINQHFCHLFKQKSWTNEKNFQLLHQFHWFVEMISALLSICCMLLLGFADDVLDLRWRHKLILPTIASLPLLMVYYVNFNSTTVIVPRLLRTWMGYSVNLGIFYYIYMGMLAVFCTNAINILAGINGLEVGQSIVIAASIAVFNLIELTGEHYKAHRFSIQFIMPYIAASLALLKHNWYPAKVFVGDTFCYFSGMTFAVLGILGHFSKTMLLFFIPQIFNFLYSLPQLFGLVTCPRHRMPRFNAKTGNLEPSMVLVKESALKPGVVFLIRFLAYFKLLRVQEEGKNIFVNNMTLINLTLIWTGPIREPKLTTYLMAIQLICSCIAFTIRYPLAYLFYELT